MKSLTCLILVVILTAELSAVQRNLIVVNGLGETADFVDLTNGTITHQVATLGLAPNDFLVAGNTGIAINSMSSDLYFFSLPSMAPLDSLFLGNGRNPYTGALVGNDTVLISNLLTSTVTKVDVSDRHIIGEYNVGLSPEGVLVVDQKAYLCITRFDFNSYTYGAGLVQVFDLNTNTVSTSIPVGTNPQDIALGYDGLLYVICTGDYTSQFGIVYKIDPTSNSVSDSLPVGGSPGSLAVTRSGVLFLAAGGFSGHGEIYTVGLKTFALLRGPANPIYSDLGVTSVVAVSDSTVVSCNFSDDTITEIDPGGHIIARYNTGDGPVAAAKYLVCYVRNGDADGSGIISISDAVALIGYVFNSSPLPATMASGDMDCNRTINISDVVAVIGYVFNGSPGICGCAD